MACRLSLSLKIIINRKLKKGDDFGVPLSSGEETEIHIVREDGTKGTGKMVSSKIKWGEKDAYALFISDITEQKENQRDRRFIRLADAVL